VEKHQKIWEIIPKVAVNDSYSLSLVYTPGVGRVSLEIAENPEKSFELTNRANSIALIFDNPEENMFKKAAFLNKTSGIDAYPLVLSNCSPEDIAKIIINLEPTFGGFILSGVQEEKKLKITEILNKENFSLPVYDDNILKLSNDFWIASSSTSSPPRNDSPLSLEEKSVELHRKEKGVIKTFCNPDAENITDEIKTDIIAIISDGSAVLGLGNIGAEAALPVMEGKSVLFKTLGDVNAMPVCLKTQDTDELIDIITKISPVLSGINLEDISAPRCFEIEKALIEKLDIPVFHDDQHGTAVVVLAGFINALKLTGKKAEDIKVVVNGAGAGAIAVSKLLISYGVENIILCDRTGAIYKSRTEGMNFFKQEMANITNPNQEKGQLSDVIENADFFIGLSAGNVVSSEMVKSMANKSVVFALANPVPEIMPDEALKAGAFIVATGRSDYKNQVNNSLAFPGIFRGVLDSGAKKITEEMKISASCAIANLVGVDDLNPEYIIPHALDLRVAPAVAKAVKEAVK